MNTNQSNPNPLGHGDQYNAALDARRKAAQTLGRLGRGHKKTLTDQERQRRADWARGLAKSRKPQAQPQIDTK